MTDHCSTHRETRVDDSPRGERYPDDRTVLANVYDGASLRAILFDDREVARYREETALTVVLTPAGQCRVDGACPGVQRGDGVETDGREVVDGRAGGGSEQIGKAEVIPRDELEKTGENEHGPCYRCPRCGFEYVAEYCDCPECLWAGMCREGFE